MKKNSGLVKYIVFSVFLAALMFLAAVSLIAYVRSSVYQERCAYLTAQSNSIGELVNKTIMQYLNYANILSNTIDSEYENAQDIYSFTDNIYRKLKLNAKIILVDSNSTWYSVNHTRGRITLPEYYTKSSPSEMIYITTGSSDDVESVVFRITLRQPFTIEADKGQVEIRHCAVIYFLSELDKQISDAFPFECNSFIVDKTGLMLYRQFNIGKLINGNNIFAKYQNVDFMFDSDAETQLQTIYSGNIAVGEFRLVEEDYFVCTAPLDINSWYISFIVNADTIGAGTYVQNILKYMIFIGIVFSAVVIVMFITYSQININNRMLAAEREANALLEKASRAKSDFLSNMSHDIRTPLNGIMGMTTLAMKEDNPPQTAEYLRKIDVSSHYLLSLVTDVLDMSRIENGLIEMDITRFKMGDFLENVETIIQGRLYGRELSFTSDFSSVSGITVESDKKKLLSILVNILGNAVKYTPDGGTITFKVTTKGSSGPIVSFCFEISDTGKGMSREFLAHIWERFSQADSSSRTKYEGTGLGMSITKNLVDYMGGTIAVESEPGVGSTFTVVLPIKLASKQTYKQEKKKAPVREQFAEEIDLSGVRLLVAEDNEINMEIVMAVLESKSISADAVENGRLAVEKFRDSEPGYYSLILMDVMMPELNGIEATKAIRELDRRDASTIPIIAMTANSYEEDVKAMLQAGMNDHISKPINIEEAIKLISGYLRKECGK